MFCIVCSTHGVMCVASLANYTSEDTTDLIYRRIPHQKMFAQIHRFITQSYTHNGILCAGAKQSKIEFTEQKVNLCAFAYFQQPITENVMCQ